MGLHKTDYCFFTGLTVQNIQDADMRDAYEYLLDLKNHKVLIRLPHQAKDWENTEPFFKDNKYLFSALLINNKWFDDQTQLITIDKLKSLVNSSLIPKTPQEKTNILFQRFFNLQKEDGQIVRKQFGDLYKELYFKSNNELIYYTRHLAEQGLIEHHISDFAGGRSQLNSYNLTVKGLNYGIKLQTDGNQSNLCFIAMAFKKETKLTRTAIKEALIETGFQPILIDEQNIESDRTINDEIIANLKRCRFCIADFSYHSNGVYFESGFALGQGKKVIYTCQEDEFKNAHFDIRPLQHIIYKTSEQLKKDLVNKIEAWIK